MTGTAAAGVLALVPAQDPAPPPGQLPEFGNSSPVGLVVVLILLLVTVFLVVSMSKRLKRLPESFDDPEETAGADAGAEPGRDRTEGPAGS
ncbi:hypothetical protein [Pseudonocardia phyllosphaerae]|uniref:hypothetical protein n=1 Tax=Pseudonocardia phyllosphaerae TaxID=3390502 RepID=UPI0039784910